MCFSAGASFAGAVVISTVGVAAQGKVTHRSQRLLAVVPLLFALQQFAEGALWITLGTGEHGWLQAPATGIFLVTALVIWPTMIPLSMRFLEERELRKKILNGMVIAGVLTSFCYAYCLIAFDVAPQISGFHIKYVDNFPGRLIDVAFGLYLAVTILPLFVSSVRRMWLFGILVAASCAVTAVFFSQYLTSVWCFFAALISVTIYWVLSQAQEQQGLAMAHAGR